MFAAQQGTVKSLFFRIFNILQVLWENSHKRSNLYQIRGKKMFETTQTLIIEHELSPNTFMNA